MQNVSGFLKGRPHVLVPAEQELKGVNMAFRNIEFKRKKDSSAALMNVLSTRPLHWLLYAMVCRLDMSVQSFLLTASALGAPEHKANVLTVCVRRGLFLPRLPIAQHHVVRPLSGGGTHGLAMHTVISAGSDAPPATSIFENLDHLLATHEGTWSAYAKLSIFHRYSRLYIMPSNLTSCIIAYLNGQFTMAVQSSSYFIAPLLALLILHPILALGSDFPLPYAIP